MDDKTLLERYWREGSQEAFRAFVERNADWVFSACRRRLGDDGLAEDATQAVFLAAAQKAPTLCRERMIGPWLYRAARYAAASMERERVRRVRREEEAAIMKEQSGGSQEDWRETEVLLEPAMDRLAGADREAIVLHFFQKKTHAEIGATLQISEAAAQKRLSRALERLRKAFSSKGTVVPAAVLAALLKEHAVHASPATLVQHIGTGLQVAGKGSLGPIVHDIVWRMIMAKVKVGVVTALVLCLCGGAGYELLRGLGPGEPVARAEVPVALPTAAATAPAVTAATTAGADTRPLIITGYTLGTQPDLPSLPRPTMKPLEADFSKLPVVFPMDVLFATKEVADGKAKLSLDPRVSRAGGTSAGHIEVAANASDYMDVARSMTLPADPFRGKRIILSGWFKSSEAKNYARLRLGIWDAESTLLVEGSTSYTDPIHGTTGWKQYRIVADVPEKASVIVGTISLAGGGDLWIDTVQVDLARAGEATTDDQQWRLYSPQGPLYEVTTDEMVKHDGHAALRIEAKQNPMPPNAFGIYTRVDRAMEKWSGKRLRVTMWMKYEDVTQNMGLSMRAWGGGSDQKIIGRNRANARPQGSADWQEFTAVMSVPQDTQYVDFGPTLNGAGKVWVDMESVKFEILEN